MSKQLCARKKKHFTSLRTYKVRFQKTSRTILLHVYVYDCIISETLYIKNMICNRMQWLNKLVMEDHIQSVSRSSCFCSQLLSLLQRLTSCRLFVDLFRWSVCIRVNSSRNVSIIICGHLVPFYEVSWSETLVILFYLEAKCETECFLKTCESL